MNTTNINPPFEGPNKDAFLYLWTESMKFKERLRRSENPNRFCQDPHFNASCKAQQYKNVPITPIQLFSLHSSGFPVYRAG